MENHIPTMADHLLKLLIIGALLVMNTQSVHCHEPDKINITLLQNAEEKGAVCLDGTPGGYHYAEGSGDGANNWMVYLPGGGWCSNEKECVERKGQALGSTFNVTDTFFGGILSKNQSANPEFYNWNRVMIRYCDGASFTGDIEEVDPETNLHIRGARIFKAAIEEILAKGMDQADNVLLVGNSAGGLATILNCDRFKALVPNANRLKCVADSGFFVRAKDLPGLQYREQFFAKVVKFHNIAKSLSSSCTSNMDPSLCFFPENLVNHVETPLFLLNSAFDQYQIAVNYKPRDDIKFLWSNCTEDLHICTPNQIQAMKEFHTAFMQTLQEIGDCSSRGMFINSCYIHDFLWSNARWTWYGSDNLGNKTVAGAIGDWYFDRSPVHEIDTKIDYPVNCTIS